MTAPLGTCSALSWPCWEFLYCFVTECRSTFPPVAQFTSFWRIGNKEAAMERRYTIYGYFGLTFIILGTAAQLWASWIDLHHEPTPLALAPANCAAKFQRLIASATL